jgi:uncharacterized protein (DUF885 family)
VDARVGLRVVLLLMMTLGLSIPVALADDDPVAAYLEAWRDFYPTRAFAYGDASRAARFEDFGDRALQAWLDLNRASEEAAENLLARQPSSSAGMDLRVLLTQVRRERSLWEQDRPRETQPQWYAERVSQALTHLLVRDQLDLRARSEALLQRLAGVAELCDLAIERLGEGNLMRSQRALKVLASTRSFFDEGLRALVRSWPGAASGGFDGAIDEAVAAIERLEAHIREQILPEASGVVSIGADNYAEKLLRRSAGAYSPQALLAEASAEMREVRQLMRAEAARWGGGAHGGGADTLLEAALEAMESDRDDSGTAFLQRFRELTFAAERFVEEHALATIPKPTTLHIDLSPAHFSGAAVGGVYPSGPFDPQADTLFYVPSIPDSAPDAAREGFYRSFNTHFNTMIISHEMFPGHYLQYKVAVSEAPALRSLFPDGAYVEGWGSFVEELMLDAGWADNAPLTRLAHLRKRLENATRAYVSVQVHTAGWGEDQVLRFAREEGLLAPQFAQNLWQRAVHSPLQITDYMRGYKQFQRLYARRDPAVPLRDWVDAVLRAGPVPVTMLPL